MAKATRLKKLRLTELSGVDSPANEAEGWMVLKSKAGDAKEILGGIEKDVLSLDESLLSDGVGHYLAEAPDEVQSAASTLHEHLAKDIVEVDPEQDEEGKVSIVKTIRDIFLGDEEIEKAEEETPETDEETVEVDETPEAEVDETVEVEETDEVEKADEESAEESDEDTEEAPEAEETEEEAPEAEESDESEEAPADEETSDETPEISDEAEAIAKELGDIVRAELDPMREALGAALDRIEGLEKASARSRSLDPDVESIAKDRTPTVGDAFRIAAARSGNSVTLD